MPREFSVDEPFAAPILALGARRHATFCIGVGHSIFVGPQIGHLDTPEAEAHYRQAVTDLEDHLGVQPRIVAHDLHAELGAAHLAEVRRASRVSVQHHHAHVTAAMLDHGLRGPVLGVVFDGAEPDSPDSGCELILASRAGYQPVGYVRPFRAPGGEQAGQEIWRGAIALLEDAFGHDAPLLDLGILDRLDERDVASVRRSLAHGVDSSGVHGIARHLDALAALVLARNHASHDGEAVAALARVAEPSPCRSYPFRWSFHTEPWQLDLRPLVRRLVRDLVDGRATATIAARIFATLGTATAEAVTLLQHRFFGRLPVVVTGDCFENRRLLDEVHAALSAHGDVLLPKTVAPTDAGLALGQALIAASVVESRAAGLPD